MTARQMYEAMLIEMNKEAAPSILLEDFNYFANKAVYQYINKRYNIYDINQQTTDDIRVLKATAVLPVTLTTDSYGAVTGTKSLYGAAYEAILPSDYLHVLNCICEFNVTKTFKCYDTGDVFYNGAKRLTADMWSLVINNFYARPSYRNPYYYIHNVNTNVANPTYPYTVDADTGRGKGTDITSATTAATTNATTVVGGLPKTIKIGENAVTSVERAGQIRFGNVSEVRMEIRYGKDNSLFQLNRVHVDYIKTPQQIRLTQTQIDLTEDTSQILEYQDYVVQEIIKELVVLMMENASDPRIQTNIPVNQAIANPAQQEQQTR